MRDFTRMRVLVVGMARSGIATSKLLYKLGTKEIILNDMRPLEAFGGTLDELLQMGMTNRLGEDPGALTHGVDLVVFSGGVPFFQEWIQDARKRGIPCINEIELGYWVAPFAKYVAITGTNGKTTTTTLVQEILQNDGRKSYAVGNIGDPLVAHAYDLKPGDIAVTEVAPSQLVSTKDFHADISAILNITEDHLDWFGTMENYVQGKYLVFQNQTKDDYCILNYENDLTRQAAKLAPSKVFFFSINHVLEEGAYLEEGKIVLQIFGRKRTLMDPEEIRIPGKHNLENSLAAILIAALLGVPDEVIADTLRTFNGVEHRIETVDTIDGVTYINDSKGTNPDATIMAIRAMRKPTVLILGGYDKHADFEPMFREFTPQIAHIVVLGQTKDRIVKTAKKCGFTAVTEVETFEDAVTAASKIASPGMNVLLSPACASWGMFENFEERGRVFKQLVMEMK